MGFKCILKMATDGEATFSQALTVTDGEIPSVCHSLHVHRVRVHLQCLAKESGLDERKVTCVPRVSAAAVLSTCCRVPTDLLLQVNIL